MVKKQHAFNFLALAIAVILVVLISLHFLAVEEKTFTFSGANIYRAVYVYEAMHEQGYAVALEVEGKWIDTNTEFKGSGTIVKGERGQFIILHQDREVSVGGPASAKEDISAKKLYLKPLHPAVIKLGLEPLSYNSASELYAFLFELSEKLTTAKIYETAFSGSVMIDTQENLKPTLVQELSNILKSRNGIVLYENGIRLDLENTPIDDLNAVSELLKNKGIKTTAVSTSRAELYIRAESKPSESRVQMLETLKNMGFKTYFLKIITNPLP